VVGSSVNEANEGTEP